MDIASTPVGFDQISGNTSSGKLDQYRDRDFSKLKEDDINRVAKDFESVFLAQMLQPMFKQLSTGGPFGGGHAEGIYRSMLTEEYGKMITQSNGIGIADMVRDELLKLQEVSQ